MPKYSCGGVVRNFKMKIRRSCRSSLTFPSTMFAVGVGLLCVVYIQVSHSASISVSTDASTPSTLEPVVVNNNTSSPASPPPARAKPSTKSPSRITTLRSRLGRPFKAKTQRVEVPPPIQPGRMKASDIKACISKAFCEVNSASKVPNYAVNKEFFDLMNQIDADRQSEEDADSGSTSVEYDEDEEDEEDDDDASSEESSSERLRGYPPPPPPGYRFGRKLKNGGNSTSSVNGTSATAVTSIKVKDSKKKHVLLKKSGKKTKVAGKKMLKKYANGTLIVVPKRRRSRLEIQEEKKQQEAYLTRKQREMGQVNDLAALIRISADIGLTLRNPRKCRTLFNKCTMSHEQIVDLFNQTLMAVTTPVTANNAPNLSSSPTASYNILTTTTKQKKGSSTSLAASSPTLPSKPQSTSSIFYSELPTVSTSIKSTLHSVAPTSSLFVTTQAPHTSTPDDNRSSKSRHDFSDEDVEYLTDTEIQPVQTYALFVNDAPEDSVKTAEEVNVQETFKKYANAFPAESPLPGDLPSLRERNKNLKPAGSSGRSTKHKLASKRGKPSSEEDDDDDDDDEDDVGSTSLENRSGYHSSRIDSPYHGYNRDMKEDDADSREPASAAKESNEGILPPLVEKEKPYKPGNDDEDEEDDEEDSDESLEADGEERNGGRTQTKSKSKKKGGVKPAADDESSEEDDIDAVDDDHQSPPAPWTPVYQMHMSEKEKKGHKKKQKGPYKGGEGPYDDIPHPGPPPAPSHSSGGVISSALNSLKKPWGGSSASHEVGQEPAPHYHRPSSHSQEVPYGDAPYHHGGPPPGGLPYGAGPLSASQEAGGMSEQKPGFFQSIMSWFTGNKNDPNAPNQPDSPYGAAGPYGGQPPYGHAGGGGSAEHHHHHHPQMDDHHEHQTATGSPWPSQPDPAGVGHFGQSHAYRYRNPESSEEDSAEEILLQKPMKQKKKMKRRFRGRSDSIITSPPKKTSPGKKAKTAGGPPPPIVIVPKKDTKSSGGIGVYEQLMQADGGITSGSNMGKKKTMSSNKENKRTKKAAIKPKNNQNQTPSKKKRRPSQKSHANRGPRESGEDDDDEAYSSEEIYNQQVAKLKSGGSMELVSLGGGSSNSNGANKGGSSSNKNSNKNGNKQSNSGSFTKNFESMFGTEEKDKHTIKGKDDGGLLYGFDALSSTLNASPLELPTVATKKSKPSTYKVNKNKKKQKKKGSAPPVKFNNKEVVESSEEEDKKK